MPDFADGPVAVVGRDVDQDGGASGSVAFEHDLVDLSAFELARAAHDGLLDVVGRHADGFRGRDRGTETRVAVGVAAVAGGNGYLFNAAGENLPALRVEG